MLSVLIATSSHTPAALAASMTNVNIFLWYPNNPNTILANRCVNAAFHWLTSRELSPNPRGLGTWKYLNQNQCLSHQAIIGMMNGDIVEIGLGVSDTDPGNGDALYTAPGTHIYRAERLQDGTLRVNLDRIISSGNTPPNPPVLISPANNSSITTSGVTLTVQDAGDPDNGPRAWRDYRITVSSADGTWSENSGWIINSSWSLTLPSPGVYRWSAISGDGVAASARSGPWTFTYGVPPPPTYTLSGRVTFPTGRAASNITVVIEGPGSSRAAVTTGNNGQYEISGLFAGTYTVRPESTRLSFSPTNRVVGVGAQSIPSLDFAARGDVVMLVHGWQGISGRSYACGPGTAGLELHPPQKIKDFEGLGARLTTSGRIVYYAQWTTSRLTSFRDAAADCLARQIAQARLDDRDGKITLVAHSMGGLVARTYLETSRYRWDVDRLVTLGTPHAGVDPEIIYRLLPHSWFACNNFQPIDGACELTTTRARAFNAHYSQREGVRYEFIGGAQGYGDALDSAVYWFSGGVHDGIVSVASAQGYAFRGPLRLWPSFRGHNTGLWRTNDSHSSRNGRNGYFAQGTRSEACIRQFLSIPGGGNCPRSGQFLSSAGTMSVPDSPPVFTPSINATLAAGASNTRTLTLTGTEASVVLIWDSGDVGLQLTSPDGTVLTPDTLKQIYPGGFVVQPITGDDMRLFSYTIPNPQAGQWTATVTGASSADVSYTLFGVLRGAEQISIDLADAASPGEQLMLTATIGVPSGPLTGAVTTALLSFGATSTTVPLQETAPGLYQGTITAPTEPGEYIVSVQTQPVGQSTIQRQMDTSLIVLTPGIQAIGGTAVPVDENSNGFPDALRVNAQVQVDTPVSYVAATTLYGPRGEVVSTARAEFTPATGQQEVTLTFPGQEIAASGVDGPYTVALIVVVDGPMPLVLDEPAIVTTTYLRAVNFADTTQQHRLLLPLLSR